MSSVWLVRSSGDWGDGANCPCALYQGDQYLTALGLSCTFLGGPGGAISLDFDNINNRWIVTYADGCIFVQYFCLQKNFNCCDPVNGTQFNLLGVPVGCSSYPETISLYPIYSLFDCCLGSSSSRSSSSSSLSSCRNCWDCDPASSRLTGLSVEVVPLDGVFVNLNCNTCENYNDPYTLTDNGTCTWVSANNNVQFFRLGNKGVVIYNDGCFWVRYESKEDLTCCLESITCFFVGQDGEGGCQDLAELGVPASVQVFLTPCCSSSSSSCVDCLDCTGTNKTAGTVILSVSAGQFNDDVCTKCEQFNNAITLLEDDTCTWVSADTYVKLFQLNDKRAKVLIDIPGCFFAMYESNEQWHCCDKVLFLDYVEDDGNCLSVPQQMKVNITPCCTMPSCTSACGLCENMPTVWEMDVDQGQWGTGECNCQDYNAVDLTWDGAGCTLISSDGFVIVEPMTGTLTIDDGCFSAVWELVGSWNCQSENIFSLLTVGTEGTCSEWPVSFSVFPLGACPTSSASCFSDCGLCPSMATEWACEIDEGDWADDECNCVEFRWSHLTFDGAGCTLVSDDGNVICEPMTGTLTFDDGCFKAVYALAKPWDCCDGNLFLIETAPDPQSACTKFPQSFIVAPFDNCCSSSSSGSPMCEPCYGCDPLQGEGLLNSVAVVFGPPPFIGTYCYEFNYSFLLSDKKVPCRFCSEKGDICVFVDPITGQVVVQIDNGVFKATYKSGDVFHCCGAPTFKCTLIRDGSNVGCQVYASYCLVNFGFCCKQCGCDACPPPDCAPQVWTVSFSGLQDVNCADCASLNKTWKMFYIGNCAWSALPGPGCGSLGCTLFFNGINWQLNFADQTYVNVDPWNCNAPNIMFNGDPTSTNCTINPPGGSGADYPDQVTVYPG